MNIIFDNKNDISPKVSIILLDWSCRESFHSLDYLNNQTISREQYEIIWIEYYSRRSPEIELKLKECASKPPSCKIALQNYNYYAIMLICLILLTGF